MANKHKGSNNERELVKMFVENGWRAARVAGSGVNDDSPCDVIAGKKGRKLAVECKSTRKKILYISKAQMSDFIVFSAIMDLNPVIAVKFLREGWLFFSPRKMRETGSSWAISVEEAKKEGKRIGQLVG